MKIGVIGCTHIPQAMPALPERIKLVFKSVDIILHVGDVTIIATLKKNGILLFNPGAAAPLPRNRAMVGILEVEPRSIAARYVYL